MSPPTHWRARAMAVPGMACSSVQAYSHGEKLRPVSASSSSRGISMLLATTKRSPRTLTSRLPPPPSPGAPVGGVEGAAEKTQKLGGGGKREPPGPTPGREAREPIDLFVDL